MGRIELYCRILLSICGTGIYAPPSTPLRKDILFITIFQSQNPHKLYQPFHFNTTTPAIVRALIIKMLDAQLGFGYDWLWI